MNKGILSGYVTEGDFFCYCFMSFLPVSASPDIAFAMRDVQLSKEALERSKEGLERSKVPLYA